MINFALNGIFSFSKAPLRLCIGAGLVIALFSFLAGIAEIFVYLLGGITVPGWASLFAIVSLVGGIQLFFLGVLGEYIGLIFDEVKGRPIYLLDRLYHDGSEVTQIPGLAAGPTSVGRSPEPSGAVKS